jgi:hypothetical protein
MHSHTSTILADILLLSLLTCRLAPKKIRSASVDMGGDVEYVNSHTVEEGEIL